MYLINIHAVIYVYQISFANITFTLHTTLFPPDEAQHNIFFVQIPHIA